MRRIAWLLTLGLLGCVHPDPTAGPNDPSQAVGSGETLVVYSLNPVPPLGQGDAEPGVELFQTYPVIGSTAVKGQKIGELLKAVERGIERDNDTAALCFAPRHGVRHVARDGTVTEWLICFECDRLHLTKQSKAKVVKEDVYISHKPQKLLNDTLRKANVKLAPGAEKGE